MEPIHDNGPRPDELYEMPQTRRRKLWPIIIAFLIGGLIFFGLLSIITFSVVGIRSYSHVSDVSVHSVELRAERTQIPANLESLQLISGSGPAMSIDSINRLVIDARNGAVTIGTHDDTSVWINNDSLVYDFDEGTLILQTRNSELHILLPPNYQTALFEDLLITGRNGNIAIIGDYDSNMLIAENLSINNRNGQIILYNLAISNTLDLETRNSNINLHNILSNPYNTRLFSRNGRIVVSE